MSDNLDDYDFTPSSSSNLASLFGSSSPLSENTSLTYTAPKQPKPGTTPEAKNETSNTESSVICAKVVQVWKLNEGKYQTLGKHGFAIIGSSVKCCYEIILYKKKRILIMRVKISPSFEITLKKDNFASFYDSVEDNWLIKFSSNEDCVVVTNLIEKYGGVVKPIVEEVPVTEKQDNVKNSEDVNTEEIRAKADILSRIAKMGQSILPSKDLDIDEETVETNISNTNFREKPSQVTSTSLSPTHVIPQHIQNIPNTFVTSQPMVYDPVNMLFVENRTHNTEVRINLSQISDKLNQIISLVDSNKPDDNSSNLKSKVKVLELRNENLARELSDVKEENEKLKSQLKNHEEMKVKNEENQLELRLLQEQEVVKIEKLEKQIVLYKEEIAKLTGTVEKQKEEIDDLKISLNDTIPPFSDSKLPLEDYENTENTSSEETKEKNSRFVAALKEAMNNMYGNITSNLDDGQNSEIIIAQHIKSTTLKIIQNFQQEYEA